jgi:hypothetical protein
MGNIKYIMRYFLVFIFFLFVNNFGFTQFNDYRIAYRIRVHNVGIFLFSYQREPVPSTYGIRFDDFIRTGTIFSPNYEQYENIIFFRSREGKNIIYDRAYSRVFFTDMDNIDSVIYTDDHTLTIRGFHIKEEYDYWGREIIFTNKITEEITITYTSHEMERIRRYNEWNISDHIGMEIPKNKQEGQTDLFISPIAQESDRYFLFKLWDNYVIIDCTQLFEPPRIAFQRYNVVMTPIVVYNNIFDEYFIFIEAYNYSGDR